MIYFHLQRLPNLFHWLYEGPADLAGLKAADGDIGSTGGGNPGNARRSAGAARLAPVIPGVLGCTPLLAASPGKMENGEASDTRED